MTAPRPEGIGAGLAHEAARLDRIASGDLALRADLRTRRDEVLAGLRASHERALRLHELMGLHERMGRASGQEAERLARLAYRAWRLLRNRIFASIADEPSLGRSRAPRSAGSVSGTLRRTAGAG